MKKIFILISCTLLSLCLIVPVSADDIAEPSDNEDPEKEYVEKYYHEKDINELKDEIKQVENLAKGTAGLGAKKINYDDLSFLQIKYLYDHYSDIDLAVLFNQSNSHNLYVYNYSAGDYSIVTNNAYYYDYIQYHTIKILPDGTSIIENYPNNENAYRIYKTSDVTGDGQGVYICKIDWQYELRPYHLHIINNGLGELTTTIPSNYGGQSSWDWYLYTGQEVNITYGDEGDFTGWYDVNGNLLSNDPNYIFNINQDTTLVINYYTNPQTFDYTDYFYIIIGLLVILTLNSLSKGVLN